MTWQVEQVVECVTRCTGAIVVEYVPDD